MMTWVMWAQPTGRPDVQFHHFAASRQYLLRQYGGGDVVPVRVAEATDGAYCGWREKGDPPEYIVDYRGDIPEEGFVRLAVEQLVGDLNDTGNCNTGRCQICGAVDVDDLAVDLHETQVGLVCVTTCGWHSGQFLGGLGWGDAVELALSHCGHVGLDADEMGALLEAEKAS